LGLKNLASVVLSHMDVGRAAQSPVMALPMASKLAEHRIGGKKHFDPGQDPLWGCQVIFWGDSPPGGWAA
jgi:hypothetical protein